MPATAVLRHDQRVKLANNEFDGELEYDVFGSDVHNEVLAAAVAISAPFMDVGGNLAIRSQAVAERQGLNYWIVRIPYVDEDNKDKKQDEKHEPGTWSFKFDATAAKHKITRALETLDKGTRLPVTDPVPDLSNTIGWDGKKINGVEIPVPKLDFEITYHIPAANLTSAYTANLARKTGYVNEEDWLGFEAGELLFMGPTGDGDRPTLKGQRVKPATIHLKFSASENKTGVIVPGILWDGAPDPGNAEVITKQGWDYVDLKYVQKEIGGIPLPWPRWARLLRILPRINFATLFGFGS